MADEEAEIRKAAIELLRQTDRDAAAVAVTSLIDALDYEAVEVRLAAVQTLDWLGPDAVPAVNGLVEVMLGDPEEALRRAALRAALKIDPESDLILQVLEGVGRENTREAIVRILSAAGAAGRPLRRRLQAHWQKDKAERPSPPAVDAGVPIQAPHKDGPEDPLTLWWKGDHLHVAPTPFRLLEYMWGKKLAKAGDVEEHVWGPSGALDSQIRSALHDLNTILEKAGVPWRYGQTGGYIKQKEWKRPGIS
jgi:hypothetical protein